MTKQIDLNDNNYLLRSQLNLSQVLDTDSTQPDNLPFSFSPYFNNDQVIQHLKQPRIHANFKILSLNCQSIKAKLDQLLVLISELNDHKITFDAICLQETWIKTEDLPPTINIPGYKTIHQPLHCSEHGGLLTFLKENYQYDIIKTAPKSDVWECQFIKIALQEEVNNLIIGNVYRPPHKLKAEMDLFNNQFHSTLNKCSKWKNVIIAGDFNLNLLNINSPNSLHINEFFNTTTSDGFLPKITLPTRITESSHTLIDNYFCRLKNDQTTSGILTNKISDHLAYFITLPIKCNHKYLKEKVRVRKITAHGLTAIGDEIINTMTALDLNPQANPDKNYEILTNKLQQSISNHIPIKEVSINRHKHRKSPWITTGIINSIKERDKMYCKQLKAAPHSNEREGMKLALKIYNRILQKTIRKAKFSYYTSHFDQLKDNMKKTWKSINEILNKKPKSIRFPDYFKINNQVITDKNTIAEEFNRFFINIGEQLASTIVHDPTENFTDYLTENITSTFEFSTVGETEISEIIGKLKPVSSCGYDDITPKLLKVLSPYLIRPLTLIINQSLKTGIFPNLLKIAKVIPIHKKDDKSVLSNYRPISLLPAISKIFEKVIHKQIQAYLTENNLLYAAQYGFRPKHSTELAGLQLIDMVSSDLDSNKIPLSVYLDLSKAFDTINHNILLKKLQYYGIRDTAYKLIQNYLTHRRQFVSFGCHKSVDKAITTGVPQGSILGPLLFIIYINDLPKCCQKFTPIIYADDTTLYGTLESFGRNASESINSELNRINSWLKTNKLSLNASKTRYMIFHKPRKQIPALNLTIENAMVARCSTFNYLGIHFNEHLTWNDHVKHISLKISRTIGRINCLKHLFPKRVLLTLYNSLILPHLNYGILAWGSRAHVVYKLQKKALRVISGSKYNAHSSPLFKSNHLLKVDDIHKLQQLSFFFKWKNNRLPHFFNSFTLTSNRQMHGYNTRRTSYAISRVNHEFAKSSLRHSLVTLLNQTPSLIKDKVETHSYHGFHTYVKNFFISNYNITCNIANCYICNTF